METRLLERVHDTNNLMEPRPLILQTLEAMWSNPLFQKRRKLRPKRDHQLRTGRELNERNRCGKENGGHQVVSSRDRISAQGLRHQIPFLLIEYYDGPEESV